MKNQTLPVTVYLLRMIPDIIIPKSESKEHFFTYEEIQKFPTDGAPIEVCSVFQDTRGRTLSDYSMMYHQNDTFARESVESFRRKMLETIARDCFAGKICSEDLSLLPSDDLKAFLDTLPPVSVRIPEYPLPFFWIIPEEAHFVTMQSLEGLKTLGVFSLHDPHPKIRMRVVSKKITQSFLIHFWIKYFGITNLKFTKKMLLIPTFTSN
jgi:hypothetical protein